MPLSPLKPSQAILKRHAERAIVTTVREKRVRIIPCGKCGVNPHPA